MRRQVPKFTEARVRYLSKTAPVSEQGVPMIDKYYADGNIPGLYLHVRKACDSSLRSTWVLRKQVSNSSHQNIKVVLGVYPEMKLYEARAKAYQTIGRILEGRPLTTIFPSRKKLNEKKSLSKKTTLNEAADMWFDHATKVHHYKKERNVYRERMRLNSNVLSFIGTMPLADLTLEILADVLRNSWHQEATRNHLLATLRNIFIFAIHKKVAEPTLMNTTDIRMLKLELGAPISADGHFPALAIEEMPDFMASLRGHEGIAFRMVEFQILCALRSSNARLLRWDQIHDLDTFGKARISFNKEELKVSDNGDFRIPLSRRAIEILKEMREIHESYFLGFCDYVFVSLSKRGTCLSDAMFAQVVKEMHEEELAKGNRGWIDPIQSEFSKKGPVRASAYGIARATFRSWASSRRIYQDRAVELCLHHKERSKVRAAYDRYDYFQERLDILSDWAHFCGSKVK